jgi:hypothetical protein
VTVNYFIIARNNAAPTNYKRTDPQAAPSGGLHEFNVTGAAGIVASGVAPGRFALAGASPNPFNPATRIIYSLGGRVPVRLAIYSAAGELVRLLVNETQEAEVYEAVWDGRDDAGRDLATGIYLARIEAGPFAASRKLVLLK